MSRPMWHLRCGIRSAPTRLVMRANLRMSFDYLDGADLDGNHMTLVEVRFAKGRGRPSKENTRVFRPGPQLDAFLVGGEWLKFPCISCDCKEYSGWRRAKVVVTPSPGGSLIDLVDRETEFRVYTVKG